MRLAVLLPLALSALFLRDASPHGYMYSPRTRNWVAHVDWPVPIREVCPHCLNTNPSNSSVQVCGQSLRQDYNAWSEPWDSQAVYRGREEIIVASYLDTHHNGHMELKACVLDDGNALTQECFDENPLEFVKDNDYGMPKDPDYPHRGYYAFGQGGSVKNFNMTFRVPDNIVGERVLLQWRYIAANSCSPPGYAKYFADNDLPDSYWTPALSLCTPPYPQDGTRSSTWPEQFWNCAEVTVFNPVPTVSPVPTQSPTTGFPTVSGAPSESAEGCCSENFKDCLVWESYETCLTRSDAVWLAKGPPTEECVARWAGCLASPHPCCPGLECVEDNPFYSQCKYEAPPTTPTTTAPVAPAPTHPPATAGQVLPTSGCCTQDFKNCLVWENQESCLTRNDAVWLAEGPPTEECVARWGGCLETPHPCCPGLECIADNPFYSQCKYEAAPTTPTTAAPVAPAPTHPPAAAGLVAPTSGCCTQDFKNCVDWCDCQTQTCGDLYWNEEGDSHANSNCVKRWDSCNDEDCCPGLTCHAWSETYSQCVL